MKISFEDTELQPMIEQVVAATVARLEDEKAKLGDRRLAYTEPEAAGLLGVKPYVLRDCRLRGEIKASRVGNKNVYERGELLRFLADQRL